MFHMHGMGGVSGLIRNIGRATARANRPLRARHWKARKGKPLGPKLVRGRGLHRRRRNYAGVFWAVFYLAIALAIAVAVFRFYLKPHLGW